MSQQSFLQTTATGSDINFTITTFSSDEILVYVDGVKKTAGVHYNINPYNSNGQSTVDWIGTAPSSPSVVRVVRQTDVLNNGNTAVEGRATYQAGASVKADDLNNNQTQVLRSLQEHNDQLIQTYDLEDGSVNSAKIKDASIVEGDLANSAVTSNKIADNAVTTTEILNGAVTSAKIADGTIVNADVNASAAIAGTKINPAFGSQNITTSGTVDGRDVSADGAKLDTIETNAKDDQTAAEIRTLLQSDKITASEIATGTLDGRYFTETELTNGALDGRYFTETESDARYFNVSTGDTIKDGDTFPDNDTTIATTAAINDRIIDLVDDVGGFVPIANETSFPTANPDVNNGAGTLVSIKAIGSTRTPSGGTVTIANGSGSNTVTITGCGSTVLTAGFGVIVETTTTLHTYAFHRLVPKATEVTTVAGISSNITTVANNTSNINAVAADASDIGTVAGSITNVNNVGNSIANVNTTAGSIANVNTTATNITNVNNVGNNISNVNAVHNNASNINSAVSNASNINSAVSNASNINTVAGSISNVNTTAGSISNVNTVASNISSVNNFFNVYRTGSTNPTTSLDTGDLFFNTTSNSLKVYTGSAWVDGVTATGNFAVTTGNTFTGSNNHNDNVKSIYGTGSDLEIYHTGSSSIINNSTGVLVQRSDTGINLRSDALNLKKGDDSEFYLKCVANGAAELYHDNSKKFETTSAGVQVTGKFKSNAAYNVVGAEITGGASGYSEALIVKTANGVARFTVDGDGKAKVPDNDKFVAGTGSDLQIYHDGTDSFIDNNTGRLKILGVGSNGADVHIQARSDEEGIKLLNNSGESKVELYYNNGKKFETTSAGVDVTGNLQATGNVQVNDNGHFYVGNSGDLDIYHDPQFGHSFIKESGSGGLIFGSNVYEFYNAAISEKMLTANENGAVELYHDNSKKFETTTDGVQVTGEVVSGTLHCSGKLDMPDSTGATVGRILLGTGDDLSIYHDGSHSYIDNNTGSLRFRDAGGAEKFRISGSGTQFNDDITLSNDSDKINIGASSDLQIYHNGTDSVIQETVNNRRFLIAGDEIAIRKGDLSDDLAKFHADGAVELYYDNTKRFETTTTGVKTLGDVSFRTSGNTQTIIYDESDSQLEFIDNVKITFGNDDDLQIYHNGSDSYIKDAGTGGIYLDSTFFHVRQGSGESMIKAVADAQVELYYNNSKKINTLADGVHVHGQIQLNDDGKLNIGDSDDLMIYHTNTNSFIENTEGSLYISTVAGSVQINKSSAEYMATFMVDGAVNLYYDNSKKFETTGSGCTVTGTLATGTIDTSGVIYFGPNNNGRIYTDNNWGTIFQADKSSPNTAEFMWQNADDTERLRIDTNGHVFPGANGTQDLGGSSKRWRNIYTNDLNLSNEGSANDVDGSWGDWTIQEGESDLFLKNNRSGKKYKFNLTEVS